MKKIECKHCNGTGKVKRHPYYSTIMPEQIDMKCGWCNGLGYLLKVRKDVVVIRGCDINNIKINESWNKKR